MKASVEDAQGLVACNRFYLFLANSQFKRPLVAEITHYKWTDDSSRILVGAGEAGYNPAGYALIAAWYPQRMRGFMVGVFDMAQPLGVGFVECAG